VDIDRDAPATAQGEIQIAAPPETVWAVLSDLSAWPTWNSGVRSMSFEGRLEPGSRFRWKSGAASLVSTSKRLRHPVRSVGRDRRWGPRSPCVPLRADGWRHTGKLCGVVSRSHPERPHEVQPGHPSAWHRWDPRVPQGRGRATSGLPEPLSQPGLIDQKGSDRGWKATGVRRPTAASDGCATRPTSRIRPVGHQ
jgi:hypothetical protein